MRKEEIITRVVDENGKIFNAVLNLQDYGSYVQLEFLFKELVIIEKDEHPFSALEKLRLSLEKLKLKIICQGSRVDVYPSGMQLAGFNAYELELYKQAVTSVYIFDDTKYIDRIATVEEQEKFHDKWLASLGY